MSALTALLPLPLPLAKAANTRAAGLADRAAVLALRVARSALAAPPLCLNCEPPPHPARSVGGQEPYQKAPAARGACRAMHAEIIIASWWGGAPYESTRHTFRPAAFQRVSDGMGASLRQAIRLSVHRCVIVYPCDVPQAFVAHVSRERP